MKTYTLMVGDEYGLRDPEDHPVIDLPEGYSGFSGKKAVWDPQFIKEIVARRSALKLSAVQLAKKAGYSGGYLSMVEKGTRYPSDEAKVQIRSTLDRLERGEE